MARYKAVKPDFESKKQKQAQLAKKKARNYFIGHCVWGILLIACIVIGGIYQENKMISGISMLAIGVLTFMELCFIAYAEKHGWSAYEVHPYDYDPQLITVISQERRKEDKERYRITMILVTLSLLGLAVWVTAAGILRII